MSSKNESLQQQHNDIIIKKRFRWSYEKDWFLLVEVERLDVHSEVINFQKWQEIADLVSSKFSGTVTPEATKDRFLRLMSLHKFDTIGNLYR